MSVALAALEVEPERRVGRYAAAAAFASVAALCGALVAANASAGHRGATIVSGPTPDANVARLHQLQDFHAGPTGQAIAVGLRCVGLALSIAVGVYLYWLVRRRGVPAGRPLLWTAVAGPIVVSAATVAGYLAFNDVADAFFASGPQTAARAAQLIDDAGTLKLAAVFDFTSRVVFAAWIAISSRHMLRLGLLTSFLGYFGIAASFALVFIPIGDAMFIGWLASIGFLAWGYWPAGRPAAWDHPAATGSPAALQEPPVTGG